MIVIDDGGGGVRTALAFGGGTVACVVVGILVGGGASIALFAAAVLLFMLTVVTVVGLKHPEWYLRSFLTVDGFVRTAKGKQDLIPAAAIKAVGLNSEGVVTELVVWCDTELLPEAPGYWKYRKDRVPGTIVLGLVDLGPVNPDGAVRGGFSLRRVQEIRAFIEKHGIAEWRNERPRLGRPG
ncbi:hypothetical protein [Spirillospora albida]|uniref:hypothetical protein n=1 Tax=Spirillospora albida TaxID=58123 RepID=UPI0004C11F1E|nr:hypothetical protein [Spirillospora albida]